MQAIILNISFICNYIFIILNIFNDYNPVYLLCFLNIFFYLHITSKLTNIALYKYKRKCVKILAGKNFTEELIQYYVN